MFTRALDSIWISQRVRPAWRHRLIAVALTMLLSAVLLIVSVVWNLLVPLAGRYLPEPILQNSPLLIQLATVLGSILLFTLLYRALPHTRVRWRDVLPGAIVAGVLWDLGKRLFLYVIANFLTASNVVYGSVTAIIALLAWSYGSSLVFLYGAHVNVRRKLLREARSAAAGQK
jgi:membrane protein